MLGTELILFRTGIHLAKS